MWTRHDYNVVVTHTVTGETVAKESLSTYSRQGVAESYGPAMSVESRGGLISTWIGGGVFITRSEAAYYLRELRRRVHGVRGASVFKTTYTRRTYNGSERTDVK